MGKTHIIGVGLDLGGTYTGTFITSHPSDETEHGDHSSAFTVVNSEKLSFSSKSRMDFFEINVEKISNFR